MLLGYQGNHPLNSRGFGRIKRQTVWSLQASDISKPVTDHNQQGQNDSDVLVPAKSKRVPEVIAENKDWLVSRWLQRTKANTELVRVTLSDAERKDHVPDLLDEAIARACDHAIRVEERQKAAERHGTLRYHQRYSIGMLILEAQLLQAVVAECIRNNVQFIEVESLLSDIAKISDTITAELREAANAYMRQYEWHTLRHDKRSIPRI